MPELFERFLLHLPIQNLIINAPLVCKKWKNAIDTSPSLQCGLFLRPVSNNPDPIDEARTAEDLQVFRGDSGNTWKAKALRAQAFVSAIRNRGEAAKVARVTSPFLHSKLFAKTIPTELEKRANNTLMCQPPIYQIVLKSKSRIWRGTRNSE